ncbi:hypothetical protein QA640_42605 [Bradyrhizobium sp. CB82]|uniref:hypothetical protein n=1 Tax=Bradyrhizobium sp. CB82 TaxID=3039159 RepID=UPI0024B11DDF|nr:hypothetical protein [Bradyrhizobium sp. CB82]WFU40775.1 hypothetical protein QA640_42605 [Bradyrhizobium sp. CB82]
MKTSVTIKIDTDDLRSVTDTYLASLWHVAQANPADPFQHRDAGRLAEHIGREIISRFLRRTPPELWNHNGSTFDFHELVVAK